MPHLFAEGFWTLAGLVAIRVGVVLRLTPFLGGRPLPLLPWAAISTAMTAVLVQGSAPLPSGALESNIAWIALAAKELFIGVVLGALINVAFSVLETAGGLARVATLSIPTVGVEAPERGGPFVRLYTLSGTAVFLLIDGHHALIAGLARSIRCLEPGVMPGSMGAAGAGGEAALQLFALAMTAAITISTPIFAAGFIAELFVAVTGRLSPSLSHQIGAQTIRNAFVQIAMIVILGMALFGAVRFVERAMAEIDVCAAIGS